MSPNLSPSTPDRLPRAVLLGAFDRFNYGDLLFPLVSQQEIQAHSAGTPTAVHALIASDLSRYGALPTLSMRSLYRPGALNAGDAVIYAGGGTVGVDWHFMLSNLLGPMGNRLLGALPNVLGWQRTNRWCGRYFGARSPFPWVAGPEDFPVPVKVAYNAIGGSELGRARAETRERTLERLARASYLSVRDTETRRVFEPVLGSVDVHVAPDSAVLMSEQFPRDWLRAQASAGTRRCIDEAPYICFHANRGYVSRHLDAIVLALEQIHEAFGLHVVLLPIGRYVGLDDHLGLAEVAARLRMPHRQIGDQASLWDIMLTLAQARLFVGTSLHGAVTSQSFAVPHLGLSERPSKLDHYLQSWDIECQSTCIDLRAAGDRAARALEVPQAVREAKRQELITLAHANFAALGRACGLPWQ